MSTNIILMRKILIACPTRSILIFKMEKVSLDWSFHHDFFNLLDVLSYVNNTKNVDTNSPLEAEISIASATDAVAREYSVLE